MFNYLVEKLYYALNPHKVWTFTSGTNLKRKLADTNGPVPGNLGKYGQYFNTAVANNYEYIKVKGKDEIASKYLIEYYEVTYNLFTGEKKVIASLDSLAKKEQLEKNGYSIITTPSFEEGIKK